MMISGVNPSTFSLESQRRSSPQPLVNTSSHPSLKTSQPPQTHPSLTISKFAPHNPQIPSPTFYPLYPSPSRVIPPLTTRMSAPVQQTIAPKGILRRKTEKPPVTVSIASSQKTSQPVMVSKHINFDEKNMAQVFEYRVERGAPTCDVCCRWF